MQVALLSALLAVGSGLGNGNFEGPAEKGRPSGWTFELGAQNGAPTPESRVVLDEEEKHGGKASLCFEGDGATRGWIIAKAPIDVRPGGKYRLGAWTRAAGVRPNGFGLDNCYVGLFLFDGNEKLVGREIAWPQRPDSAWTEHELTLVADPAARTGYVYVFLSMIGRLWVDDLELTISGGEPIPELEVVWREDFAKMKRVGSDWKKKEGASNGTGGSDSKFEIDPEIGAPDSPCSLRLSGDADTMRWTHLVRELTAEPGDLWRFVGKVRAENVRQEGVQFANLHLNLAYVDAKGKVIGSAHFSPLDPGTREWTDVAVDGVAPLGTKKVHAGVFLSMSGTAWFDDLELSVLKGLPVPYGDWLTLEGKGVILRYASDHPHANEMKAHLSALEESKRATCRALEVEFPDKITVFVYTDLAQGKRLTGKSLDFADPQNRCVHQQWESYIGHEMVHVIAHTTLTYAQTGLLGEGIAVWLNGQFRDHHEDAKKLLDENKLPSVKDLLERFRELDAGYPAAGSFCGFLLETHGLEIFKQLYPLPDPSAKLKELAGQTFEDLEPAWHERIRRA